MDEFEATQDVQWEAGRCSDADDIIEKLMLEYDDPAVVKWAQDRLAELRERTNEVESFARIIGR